MPKAMRIQSIFMKALASVFFFATLPIMAVAYSNETNGGVRGGGDIYAGELFEVERSILLKIDLWVSAGELQVSSSDLERVKAVQKIHDVTSRPHACLGLLEKSNGECVNPDDERDIVNDPFSNPPRVIIGRIRWDGYRDEPLDKETLTLHEMLEVALTKDSKIFVDKTFEKSYRHRLDTLRDWEIFKSKNESFLRDLHRDDQDLDEVDLRSIHSFLMGLNRSTDYTNCIHSEGRNRDARKLQKKYCIPLFNAYIGSVSDVILPDLAKDFERVDKKVKQDYSSYLAWLKNTTVSQSWKNWAYSIFSAYIGNRQVAINQYNYRNSQIDAKNLLSKVCPLDGDLSHLWRCAYLEGLNVLQKAMDSSSEQYLKYIDDSYRLNSGEFISRIKPI